MNLVWFGRETNESLLVDDGRTYSFRSNIQWYHPVRCNTRGREHGEWKSMAIDEQVGEGQRSVNKSVQINGQ